MSPREPALEARAYAKINLGLEVLGLRDDGYHELRTVLQTIDLQDRLVFEARPEGIQLKVTGLPGAPPGPDNLVHRAATLLAKSAGARAGAVIHLEKNIPVGSGLGGGSADAAMTLLALDRLWRIGSSAPELHRLAASLGMDVPFFLEGGTALAVSRGEEIYPLPAIPELAIVLILPDFSISTARAYANLRLTKGESGLKLQHFAWGLPNARLELAELGNDLEEGAGEHTAAIQEYKRLLLGEGAAGSMMSGSGSSILGVFHDEASAEQAVRSLRLRGIRAIVVKTLGRDAYRAQRLMPLSPFSSERAQEANEL